MKNLHFKKSDWDKLKLHISTKEQENDSPKEQLSFREELKKYTAKLCANPHPLQERVNSISQRGRSIEEKEKLPIVDAKVGNLSSRTRSEQVNNHLYQFSSYRNDNVFGSKFTEVNLKKTKIEECSLENKGSKPEFLKLFEANITFKNLDFTTNRDEEEDVMKLIDYDSLTSNYESESIHSIKNSTQVQSIHTNENREYSRKDNRTEDLDNLDSNVLVSKLGNLMMGDLATINEQHSDKSHDSKYNSVQSNSEVGSENNSFIMYSTHNQYKTESETHQTEDEKNRGSTILDQPPKRETSPNISTSQVQLVERKYGSFLVEDGSELHQSSKSRHEKSCDSKTSNPSNSNLGFAKGRASTISAEEFNGLKMTNHSLSSMLREKEAELEYIKSKLETTENKYKLREDLRDSEIKRLKSELSLKNKELKNLREYARRKIPGDENLLSARDNSRKISVDKSLSNNSSIIEELKLQVANQSFTIEKLQKVILDLQDDRNLCRKQSDSLIRELNEFKSLFDSDVSSQIQFDTDRLRRIDSLDKRLMCLAETFKMIRSTVWKANTKQSNHSLLKEEIMSSRGQEQSVANLKVKRLEEKIDHLSLNYEDAIRRFENELGWQRSNYERNIKYLREGMENLKGLTHMLSHYGPGQRITRNLISEYLTITEQMIKFEGENKQSKSQRLRERLKEIESCIELYYSQKVENG